MLSTARPLATAFAALATLSLAAAGCSDGTVANPSVDAGFTINGHPFSAQAEASVQIMTNGDVPMPAGWIIELYNTSGGGCSLIMSSAHSGTLLRFQLPIKAMGTFDVGIGNTVFSVDGNDFAATPKSGTLNVIKADGKRLAGSYDVTFVSGEHLAGTFDAPVCS